MGQIGKANESLVYFRTSYSIWIEKKKCVQIFIVEVTNKDLLVGLTILNVYSIFYYIIISIFFKCCISNDLDDSEHHISSDDEAMRLARDNAAVGKINVITKHIFNF